MEFQVELKKFLARFEPYFQSYFQNKIRQASQYHPLIEKFYKDLADFSSGGKRMRAFLVYLGYQVAGGRNLQKILPIALAAEVIHSFLLIHDDIIDRSDTRRAKPTIHARYEKNNDYHYGLSQAILIGDIACFEAIKLINSADFSQIQKTKCIDKFVDVLLETGYGEALDVLYTYRRPSLAQIWQVLDFKTARYSFVGPISIGAILGKVGKSQLSAISKFGLAAGIAFQFKDDTLGVFGSEQALGKPLDFAEGKNTILIYKTRELATEKDKAILDSIWGNKNATARELANLQQIIKRSGALAWCENEQAKLVKKAKGQISTITSNLKLQSIFAQFADFVINRQK